MISLAQIILTFDAFEYRELRYFPVMTPRELSLALETEGIRINLPTDKDWVYLSCRLTGMSDLGIPPWQLALKSYCDAHQLVLIDPKDHYTDGWSNLAAYIRQPGSDPALVVALDYFLILRSKLFVLDMTKGPSFGTAGETIYAQNVRVPSVVITDPGHPLSPWVNYYAGASYSPEEFISKMASGASVSQIAYDTVKESYERRYKASNRYHPAVDDPPG